MDLQSKPVHLHWPCICGLIRVAQRPPDLSGLTPDFAKDLNVIMNGTRQKMGFFFLYKSCRFLKRNSSLRALNICHYLCKMEHLEKPRAWYLLSGGLGKEKERLGFGPPMHFGPKACLLFPVWKKDQICWSCLVPAQTHFQSVLRIPSFCLAEGKCGSQ